MTSKAIINGWPIAPPTQKQYPPVVLTIPVISGTFAVGNTLTSTQGTFDGFPAMTYTYQWHRAGAAISGATSSTYILVDADSGKLINCAVIATNSVGRARAVSADGYVVPSTGSGALSISGTPGLATVNVPYSFTPSVSGGKGTRVFVLTGSLPSGLSFNTATGAITGTPTATGTTSGLSIKVTDDSGNVSLVIASLVVASALSPTSASYSTSAAPTSTIAAILGLASGETLVSVIPNDGRLAVSSSALLVGLSASSAGSIAAVITTSAGRTLNIALTVTAAVVLGTLALSGSLVNGTASSGTISGATSASTITTTLAGLTINSSARTYSFDGTTAGGTSGNLVETLAGATGSPKSTAITVAAAGGAALLSVFPSGSLATGVPSSGSLMNATPGSTITSSMSGLTINSAARTYTWDGTPTAGTTGNIVETLAGASNSPKSNPTGCVNKNVLVGFGSSDVAGQKVSAYGADPAGPTYPSPTGSWFQLLTTALKAIDSSWVVWNRSISGTGTAQSVSRFDSDVKPYFPSHVFIGTHCKNDSYDSSVYTPNTVALIAKCRSLGIIPIVRGGYPSDGPTNSNYADMLAFNVFLDTLGVHRIDHMSTMDDGTGNILLSSTYSPDNLHCNDLGHAVRFTAVDLGIFTGGATSTAPITYSTAAWSVTTTGSTQLGTKVTPQRVMKSGTWRIRNKAPGNNAMCPLAIYGPTNASQPILRIRNSSAVWAMSVNDNSQEVLSTFDATSSTSSADIIVTYNALNKAAKFYLNGAYIGGYTLTTSDDISDFTFGGRKETTGNPYVLPTNTCEAWLVPLSATEIARLYSKSTTHPGSKILQGNQSAAPPASGSTMPNDIPNGILPVLNTTWQTATAF